MKPHPLFLNILLIGVFSLSLPTPEDVSGASLELVSGDTPPVQVPAMNTPDALPSLLNISAIAAGRSHTCALTTGGGVKCWGSNGAGQLGDGTNNTRLTTVNVSGLASGVSAIVAGGSHTCALTEGGGVKCWGSNALGQLGNGTTTTSYTPVNVSGLSSGVSAVTAGHDHTCALTSGGRVKCWGYNGFGQLGDDTTIERHTPVNVSGMASEVSAIDAGYWHTCARTTTGGIKCWGDNTYGQLGDGTTTERHSPVNVSGLASGVSAVTAGHDHTCSLTEVDGVKCWGWNTDGQLGDGTTTWRLTPVDVSGLASGVSSITVGWGHTCARTASGGVKCWGRNNNGQLGDGSITDRHTPVDVSGLASGVSAIATGDAHTCARTTEGGAKCWGWNDYGQLGDGTTTEHHTPVNVVDPTETISYRSIGYHDGWVLESSENSNMGGSMNSTSTTFNIGDEAADKQYRAILSFNTGALPDTAVITKATLKIKKQGLVGSDPFTALGGLRVDMRKPFFGSTVGLVVGDFQATAGKSTVATFGVTPVSNWYSAMLNATGRAYINLTGTTQFRLRFAMDDNNDNGADYLKFYSGNYSSVSLHPLLVIQYYVP